MLRDGHSSSYRLALLFCWLCALISSPHSFSSESHSVRYKQPQFSFAAPLGWRLEKQGRPPIEYTYWLRRVGREGRCTVQLRAENSKSLADGQAVNLARLHSGFPHFKALATRAVEIRSPGNMRILKTDLRFVSDVTSGAPSRMVFYVFRSPSDGRIYRLECWPPLRYGDFFDGALDDLAKSISG